MPSESIHTEVASTQGVAQQLFDELLCVADSKFILGNWYLIALPNGRSVSDWTALSAMLQDHYGHARALYRYFARYGFTREQAEWKRTAEDIRSARVLDLPPRSWTDFVVTAYLAELAFSSRLVSLSSAAAIDPQLARLSAKIVKESRFHLMYLEGWLRVLLEGQAQEVKIALDSRFPILLEWWQSSGADLLHNAGHRADSDATLRERFAQDVAHQFAPLPIPFPEATPNANPLWRLDLRRSGAPGIPPRFHELIRFKEPELAIP